MYIIQGILDNQRNEDPTLEEENRRLLQLVAELRQKMSDMHEDFTATIEKLTGQVFSAIGSSSNQDVETFRLSAR